MANTRYKLAALDMDGTLLNSAHEASPYTCEVLRRAAEAGKLIALSTGRCYSELKGPLQKLPGVAYLIAESGGWIYDVIRQKQLRRLILDDGAVGRLFDAAKGLDYLPQVFVNNQCYIPDADDAWFERCHILAFADAFRVASLFPEDVEVLCRTSRGQVGKVNFYFSGEGEKARFLKGIEGLDVSVTDSLGVGFEISPPGATKDLGLRALCEAIGLPIEQTLAVGDGGNDLDIMAAAGFSVAMGNAIAPVRALADAVTDDNDHDGCAHALEKYLLGEMS